jgi:5-formyltetrahydrofolate cyclo-ligase
MKNLSPKQIRQQIRAARKAIPAPYAQQASYKFSEQFGELSAYQSATRVAGFLPFDGEANPLPLMDRAILESKQVFVPIIVAKGEPLLFAPWSRTTKLKPNQFGIDEPDVAREEMIAGHELDFVITPLVAFDEDCHRLGVGGGFYDRTFAFLSDTDGVQGSPCSLVGIAYELQKIPQINRQSHDVRLAGVVSELATYQG